MYRYYVKIQFDNKPRDFMEDYTPTKPLELEYKTKKSLISEVMDLYDESIRSIYVLDRSNNQGSNFDINNIDKLIKGMF